MGAYANTQLHLIRYLRYIDYLGWLYLADIKGVAIANLSLVDTRERVVMPCVDEVNTLMIKPFHLSFVVLDKDATKEFYLNVLGCALGRDNETWFDILFFGHQLTIHQSSQHMPAYNIDHFGPILDKPEWLAVVERCRNNELGFVMQPTIKNKGTMNESGKFLIKDPAGNLLEFKYYYNFSQTVG